MPRHSGRPPDSTVTIADCGSVALHLNTAPRCPHELRWRETDAARISDPDVLAQMCSEPECESNEYHPHEGESITLIQPRSFGGREPIRKVFFAAIAMASGAPQPSGFAEDLAQLARDSVVAWTWTCRDGSPLPLPREDWPTVARELEYGEVLWIIEATLAGADPREAMYLPPVLASGKDSPNG